MDKQGLERFLRRLFAQQLGNVARWHDGTPAVREDDDTLEALAVRMHLTNFQLWHLEDQARRQDVSVADVASCKRAIDRMNQQRNDAIEALAQVINTFAPEDAQHKYNTETMGAALDRLSISALKIYHMDIEANRAEAGEAHCTACRRKLDTLREQRQQLEQAVLDLLDDYAAGRKRPNIYRQFKMYNDPSTNPELYGSTPQERSWPATKP